MKQIPLTQGKFATVDDDDFDYLSQWKWCARKTDGIFYAVRNESRSVFPRKTLYMHRLVLNSPTDMHTDHVDGNGLNNTRANLRVCQNSENRRNHKRHSNNSTGFIGVTTRRGRFIAQIFLSGKHISLGSFNSPEEAARAYDIAALKYFGEFASLNFKE